MTSNVKTGGPAYPCECTNDGIEETEGFNHDWIPAGSTAQYRGMTMRDYFAGKAIQGMLANDQAHKSDEDMLARNAYKMADAMLRAREK